MFVLEELLGESVINGDKEDVAISKFAGEVKINGIYFSGHWCPPCRTFTPELIKFYKDMKAGPKGDSLEIVFVSSDRDQEAFDDYFKEMPWFAMPYEERERKVSTLQDI